MTFTQNISILAVITSLVSIAYGHVVYTYALALGTSLFIGPLLPASVVLAATFLFVPTSYIWVSCGVLLGIYTCALMRPYFSFS